MGFLIKLNMWLYERPFSHTCGANMASINFVAEANYFSHNVQVPLRIVCVGADATVRIISGKTGNVITTSLVPDLTTVTDAVYSAGEGRILNS